ncbi:MAG: winged helix DNA-binding domain-containing protein [Gemmatimonadaceae bacterium]|nr:winged helix DNA-binding domain-containing protein [Gemmatimonadaceae bacterium]
MPDPRIRAWWSHWQGLDGSLRTATPGEILTRTGWCRTVGGVSPYLACFARARLDRAAVDAALAAQEIHELPSVRGCTYALPAADYALGLALGEAAGDGDMAAARKLGVTDQEIDALCATILVALGSDTLTPDALRDATGGASRSLGEAGKKKGVSTTLPLALGRLQATGDVRRVPLTGRLDTQRYAYARWSPNPRAGFTVSAEDQRRQLAAAYFRWIGPASLKEFQWFSGFGVAGSAKAVAPLELTPVTPGSDLLLPAADMAAFEAFVMPTSPQYALVGTLDTIVAARRNIAGLLEESDLSRLIIADKAERPLGLLADLPSHAVLDRGHLIGLWEYDTASSSIVCALFGRKPDKALKAEIEATEAFIRADLGDARAFSLDSPASRTTRIERLRALE